MLDWVSPHQRERCEVGIELMLMDKRFTPEQEVFTRSYADMSPLKPESLGLRKSHRRSSSQTLRLQNDDLDRLLKSHHKWMAEYAKWHDELKHTLCQSGSVGNSPQISSAKVSKPETRSQLE
jgi:hypothetical protein